MTIAGKMLHFGCKIIKEGKIRKAGMKIKLREMKRRSVVNMFIAAERKIRGYLVIVGRDCRSLCPGVYGWMW